MTNINLKLFGLVEDSIVDGPGLRLAVFVQGCSHHCKDCHNKDSWSYAEDKGYTISIDDIVSILLNNPLTTGLTLSGGEPLDTINKIEAIKELIHRLRSNNWNKSIWIYTGYIFEDLINNPDVFPILEETEVIVDGKFDCTKRSLDLKFRGSSNQRLIDVQQSIRSNSIVLWKSKFDLESLIK